MKEKKIIVVPVQKQENENKIEEYNKNQKRIEKIPVVLRNQQTGWPLFPISLFSVCGENENKEILYEPVVGGGGCHEGFSSGVFNLICLLVQSFAKYNVKIGYGEQYNGKISQEKLDSSMIDNIECEIKELGLNIKSTHTKSYGIGVLQVTINDSYEHPLLKIVNSSISDVIKRNYKGKEIVNFQQGYKEGSCTFTEKDILNAINPEKAVFHDGQIYVDFGVLLEEKYIDKNNTNILKNLFKVDEFLNIYPKIDPIVENKNKLVINKLLLLCDKYIKHLPKNPKNESIADKKLKIVTALHDALTGKNIINDQRSNSEKVKAFTDLLTDENKKTLSGHRDSAGIKFLANIGHVLTLGIISKLTKGTFKFWKSHGEALVEQAQEITPKNLGK